MKLSLYPLALLGRTGRAWIDDWSTDYPLVTLKVRRQDGSELSKVVKAHSREHSDFITELENSQF